ncbi:MAG: hypothetical protein UU76_C0012G0014 [Parcubacteria group bacterium GW2011_GWC1_41_7]|nr:MAG: hypothetical protein UU76_C0012G0014 [Parcubacteria group bacterium GW2011_GWC1_41_7]
MKFPIGLIFQLNKGISIVSKSMPKKKRLAYPIEKQILGYLGSIYVEADPESIETLKKDLRVYKGLLRFIILSRKTVPSAHDVAKEQQEQEQDQAETLITPDEPAAVSEAQGE